MLTGCRGGCYLVVLSYEHWLSCWDIMIFIAHYHCFGMLPLHECNLEISCLPHLPVLSSATPHPHRSLLTHTTHSSPTSLTPRPHHSLLTHTTHSSPTSLTPHPHHSLLTHPSPSRSRKRSTCTKSWPVGWMVESSPLS